MKVLLIALITCYQRLISPLLPHQCRFYPSCSVYMKNAIQTHGLRGLWSGLKRICKCHPFHPGGVDLNT